MLLVFPKLEILNKNASKGIFTIKAYFTYPKSIQSKTYFTAPRSMLNIKMELAEYLRNLHFHNLEKEANIM
jgi:hypothetical protein